MSSAPLIGVSASLHDFGDYGGVGVHRPVLLAGGLPMTLPQLPDAIAPALDAIDALVLAPGRDIEPHRYGQQPHPLLAATEPQRDAFELELVVRALERGLPILGMCRGLQVLNVALGGTLAQDVSLSPRRIRATPAGSTGSWSRRRRSPAPRRRRIPPRDRGRARQPARARDRRHGRGQLVSHQASTLGEGLRSSPRRQTASPRRSSCQDGPCSRCNGSFRRNGGSTAASCACSSGSWTPPGRAARSWSVARIVNPVPPRVTTGGCCARTQEPKRSSAARGDEDAAQRRRGSLEWQRSNDSGH